MLRKFILVAFTLCATTLYALQGCPTQPDYAQFEPSEMPALVSMQAGNFPYPFPLGGPPGPYGNYPLRVAYHAGISPQQEATWVGLGWTLNPGVINRDVRGVPDDQFHGGTLGFIYQYSAMQTWTLDMGWSYGIFRVGSTTTNEGGVGFSATIGPKIAGVAGVGFTVGTDAVGIEARVGYQNVGLNASLMMSTSDGSTVAGVSVSASIGPADASAGSRSMRATPCCQCGRVRPKVVCSLLVFRRELCGRCAGVGKALVGTGAISCTWMGSSGRRLRACSMT